MKGVLSWLWDWRVAVGLGAGFLLGMLIFGTPWHLPPAWGDIPTWLLVVLAGLAGWVGFDQLRLLQQQLADETDRNVKRDELLDRQLAEAETRALSERRKQAEDIEASYSVSAGNVFAYVENNSRRPITNITCNVMSGADGKRVASPDRCAEVVISEGATFGGSVQRRPMELALDEAPVPFYKTLRPGKRCRFTFDRLNRDPGHVVVVWFTDDAGFRWRLDENMHLAPARADDEYLP